MSGKVPCYHESLSSLYFKRLYDEGKTDKRFLQRKFLFRQTKWIVACGLVSSSVLLVCYTTNG